MHASDSMPPRFEDLLEQFPLTPQTQAVLRARLAHQVVTMPRCFTAAQFTTLRAVCARLIPQGAASPVDLPGLLDDQLADGPGKGWRYDGLPPDAELLCSGMDAVEATAQALCGNAFHHLNETQQDEVLRTVQVGHVSEAWWPRVSAQRFFEELLAALVTLYYSHPLVKASIGDASFADAQGWTVARLEEPDSDLLHNQE